MRIQLQPNFIEDIRLLAAYEPESESSTSMQSCRENIWLMHDPVDLNHLSQQLSKMESASELTYGIALNTEREGFKEYLIQCLEAEAGLLVFSGQSIQKVPSMIPSDLMKTTQTRFILRVADAMAAKALYDHWHRFYTLFPDAVILSSAQSSDAQRNASGDMERVRLISLEELLYSQKEKQIS